MNGESSEGSDVNRVRSGAWGGNRSCGVDGEIERRPGYVGKHEAVDGHVVGRGQGQLERGTLTAAAPVVGHAWLVGTAPACGAIDESPIVVSDVTQQSVAGRGVEEVQGNVSMCVLLRAGALGRPRLDGEDEAGRVTL